MMSKAGLGAWQLPWFSLEGLEGPASEPSTSDQAPGWAMPAGDRHAGAQWAPHLSGSLDSGSRLLSPLISTRAGHTVSVYCQPVSGTC